MPKQTRTAADKNQINRNRFTRIGAQSQQCDEQPIPPVILDSECHRVPEDQVRYDGKFSHFITRGNPGNYQTYASLKGVRKIRASAGARGRSRPPSRISGLKFEYYNHPSPGIVGQWMDELDDDFELSPDEEVQSLTIWLTPTGFNTECPGMEVGQVAAIQIETTLSRSVTFRAPESHSLPSRKLHHRHQSAPGEKLTAISWILNVRYERVRAVVSAEGNRETQILVPELVPPFDQVQKIFFEAGNDHDRRDRIVTAEALFRGRAIVGLGFVYKSGIKATVGEMDSVTRQTVQFAPDDQIVGLSIWAIGHNLMEIEFEVEQDKQSRDKKLKLFNNSPDDSACHSGLQRRDIWCKDVASAESYQQPLGWGKAYKPPSESRLIGIYVGCQWLHPVGALYEPGVPS